MHGGQPDREERVSMELTDEVLKSMEVGMAFRDYVQHIRAIVHQKNLPINTNSEKLRVCLLYGFSVQHIRAIVHQKNLPINTNSETLRVCLLYGFSNGRISSMDFHKATSYLVTASADESIRLYDIQNALCLKTINSKKYGVDLVCFTSHPTTVIYSSKNGWDESLRLLSLNDNKYLRYFKGHHDRVVSLSLCPCKESFVSGSLDRTVLLWDQRAEKSQGLLRVQGRPAVSYDDQGMVFAIAFGGLIRMFDARKFEKGPFDTYSVGADKSEANVLKFSSDGRLMLLTTMDGHIHILDSFRGNLLSTYNVKPVSSHATLEASFSPDGMYILSGSGDGSVYAWSVRSGKVACWASTDVEPPLIKWAPGSLMFTTGSSELSFWVPDLSKLGSFVGSK